jgi:catechol 2,3-dioxygenase-like lactoylglutathione lyase family enzyme
VPVVGINHVRLSVPPGQQAWVRQFYGEWLELPEIPASPELVTRGYVGFQVGSQRLDIGLEPDFPPAGVNHPGFNVSGREALKSRLESRGVTIILDDPPTGDHRFHVHDSFGNRLEFDGVD